MDMPLFMAPISSIKAGSSTTTTSKFCMLCAVGAHLAASSIVRKSSIASGLSTSKGARADSRSLISCKSSLLSTIVLAAHLQHRSEVHGARHHLVERLRRLFQRKHLDHGHDFREQAEFQRVVHVATDPASDRPHATHQHARGNLHGFVDEGDDDHLAVAAQ